MCTKSCYRDLSNDQNWGTARALCDGTRLVDNYCTTLRLEPRPNARLVQRSRATIIRFGPRVWLKYRSIEARIELLFAQSTRRILHDLLWITYLCKLVCVSLLAHFLWWVLVQLPLNKGSKWVHRHWRPMYANWMQYEGWPHCIWKPTGSIAAW